MDNFEERIKKQPKWVQDQFTIMSRNIERLRESNKVLSLDVSGKSTGRLSATLGPNGEWVDLPDHTTLRWFNDGGHEKEISMSMDSDNDIVRVYTFFNPMVIRPNASNSCWITTGDVVGHKRIDC